MLVSVFELASDSDALCHSVANICSSRELSHAFASLIGDDAVRMLDISFRVCHDYSSVHEYPTNAFVKLINERALLDRYDLGLHQRCCRLLRELACNSKVLPSNFLIASEGHEYQAFNEGGNARIYRARYNGTDVVLKVLRFWVDDFRENQGLLRKVGGRFVDIV